MKKFLSLLLTAALLLSLVSFASAEGEYLGVMLGTNVMSLATILFGNAKQRTTGYFCGQTFGRNIAVG